jgi:hypothetical protein
LLAGYGAGPIANTFWFVQHTVHAAREWVRLGVGESWHVDNDADRMPI